MKHETSRRKHGFKVNTLHKRKEPHVLKYLGEKASFWIATMSLFAFVIGNMVGQHGWYAFWKSVMGKGDDSLIVYTGTVHPLPKLVDYECWGKYGGDPKSHSFGQVPDQCKIPPPKYDAAHQHMLISMAYMSSYQKGSEGSGWHSGVDYRTPNGTPTVAAANGIVERVDENSGYGKYIVIKVPNAPDPDDPHNKKTELYLAYAHLSAVYVRVGDIVNKGEQIGLTGNSGSSTGYHLHFQIDRASAPWHPYWPSALFSNTKRQQLGYRYTVNPMPYIAANYNPITEPGQAVAVHSASDEQNPKPRARTVEERRAERLAKTLTRRDERLQARLARRTTLVALSERLLQLRTARKPLTTKPLTTTTAPQETEEQIVKRQEEVAVANFAERSGALKPAEVASVVFSHDGTFQSRKWERVRVSLTGQDGQRILNPQYGADFHLATAYGEAEFRPSALSSLDFKNGEAEFYVLVRGRRTAVLKMHPFGGEENLSQPLRYERTR